VQRIFDMFRVLLQQCLHIQARLELKKRKRKTMAAQHITLDIPEKILLAEKPDALAF